MAFIIAPCAPVSLPILQEEGRFPVHRIYCVARNYAEHAAEMGADHKEPPFFFTKPHDAVVQPGETIPYPPATRNLHHEVELVVALGQGGADISERDAPGLIYGYAVGIDLTRRDLQAEAKAKGRPWDVAKGFDNSAPLSAIKRAPNGDVLKSGRIWLSVNDVVRQDGDLSDMIWSIPAIIAQLSTLYRLEAGDLIFTGTPAGVGALSVGDKVKAGIDGIGEICTTIVE